MLVHSLLLQIYVMQISIMVQTLSHKARILCQNLTTVLQMFDSDLYHCFLLPIRVLHLEPHYHLTKILLLHLNNYHRDMLQQLSQIRSFRQALLHQKLLKHKMLDPDTTLHQRLHLHHKYEHCNFLHPNHPRLKYFSRY